MSKDQRGWYKTCLPLNKQQADAQGAHLEFLGYEVKLKKSRGGIISSIDQTGT